VAVQVRTTHLRLNDMPSNAEPIKPKDDSPASAGTGCSIVTGGGRGIGRAIARRLASVGPVVVVGRTADDLDAICTEINAGGGAAAACVGDIANPNAARDAVAVAQSRGWFVRHLICNAGIGKGGPTAEFDQEQWRRIFDVNVHGSFYFVQACVPGMIARGEGTLCFMSSLAGVKGVAFDAAYTASKHALVGVARSLALEYGKQGVVSVAVCPGFVESDMTRRTIADMARRQRLSEQEAERKVAATSPLRRIMSPEEVAEVVALICSGALASVSGNPLILGGS
jgi:NAD(P)-dependent dehydrogenase (short-subunit alcohol dehydrogenase family)